MAWLLSILLRERVFRNIAEMEQDTGFEPALSAWKADVLAADTNPAYGASGEVRTPDSLIKSEVPYQLGHGREFSLYSGQISSLKSSLYLSSSSIN